jgi:uncharacterized protein HemY
LKAQARIEEALQFAREKRHTGYICFASTILGQLHYDQGRWDLARSVWEEALAYARETHHRHDYLISILLALGRLAREQGERDAAQSFLREGLLLAEELRRWQLAHALEATAEVAAADGQPESALELAGAAAALRDALGTPTWPTERTRLEPAVAHARQSLPVHAAAAAWSRGVTMQVEHAVALALDGILNQLPLPQLEL